MTSRNFIGYLFDIRLYCEKILVFTDKISYEEFIVDETKLLSVIRCLEVIGEASKRVPDEIKTLYPEIPWKIIAGMRDYLIHDYTGINNQLVWKTSKNDIPVLLTNINMLIHDYE